MKCRFCKREIADNSIYCNWCGKPQAKERKISVPKPVRLANGYYTGRVMVKGQYSWTEPQPTIAMYETAARALKTQMIEAEKKPVKMTLGEAIDLYIENNSDILSKSTLRGYIMYRKSRFHKYMDMQIASIDWQAMLNEEAKTKAAKTVRNGWGLVHPAVTAQGVILPDVNLPEVGELDGPWLDAKQIPLFLEALKGTPCEFQALCALHSLRSSEIAALQPENITDKKILVRGAVVMDAENRLVRKETNKTKKSRRDIPIIIPRLLEVLPDGDVWEPTHPNTLLAQINAVCRKAGVPEVGCQGLRRSFCSLAFYLGWDILTTKKIGGWTNTKTIEKHYAKLAEFEKDADVKKMQRYFKKAYQI